MRVLVVGATGFIGSNLVEHLGAQGHEIEGWGRRQEPPRHLHRYRNLDLTDPSAFSGLTGGWDVAYLLSAHSVPGLPWNDEMVLENLGMAGRFLQFIKTTSPGCRVILASSALVYGPGGSRLTEQHPKSPGSLYALSKAMMEDWAGYAARSMDIQIVRIFNQVGPGMPKGLLASDALERLRGGSEVLEFNGSDSIRDYLDIRDGVDALMRLAEVKAPSGSAWNICSGNGLSVSGLAGLLMEELEIHKPVTFKRDKADMLVGDPTKLQEATGWTPRHPLREALKRLADTAI